MLSFIDFFMSMVMISGIGVVLALFPLLNRLGKVDEKRCATATTDRRTRPGRRSVH